MCFININKLKKPSLLLLSHIYHGSYWFSHLLAVSAIPSLPCYFCLVLNSSGRLFSQEWPNVETYSPFNILLQDPGFHICRLTSHDVCSSPLILESAPVFIRPQAGNCVHDLGFSPLISLPPLICVSRITFNPSWNCPLFILWPRVGNPIPSLFRRLQFSSVAQSCPTLWDPMDCSMPSLPVHQQLPEFTQTHVHWVSDAIQPSHPLSSPSPPALNLSQNQGLFKWVSSSHHVAKVLEFQLQHQSFQWTPRPDLL